MAATILKRLDLRCDSCGREVLDYVAELPVGFSLSAFVIECPDCDGNLRHFWPLGTRMAIVSDEKPPADLVMSAREALVNRAPHEERILPFTGDTRTELNQWMADNNIVYAAMPDERHRGRPAMTRTKITESAEFDRKLDANIRKFRELAQHPESDAYHEAKNAVEKPNAYDVNTFKEQAGADVTADAAPTHDAAVDIAAEITPDA